MTAGLRITVEERSRGRVTLLEVGGRLDSRNTAILEARLEAVAAAGAPGVIVDMAGVDYLSGTGLRVLLLAARQMDAGGRRMALCAPQAHVLDVLRISGLTRALHVHDDRRAALADFGETE